MKSRIGVLVFMIVSVQLNAQTHTEKITREFSLEKKSPENAIIIANINGDVKVVGYAGDKILVEVNKSINAKTAARLEKGKTEIKLGVLDLADTIILYVDGLCGGFGKQDNRDHGGAIRSAKNWGYNWNKGCNDCNTEYDYKLDFVVRIPTSLNISVSTINDGNIDVENVDGVVIARNINGSIRLQNLMRESDASTINGNVDVEYARNPQKDCRYYSLNGDINAWFQRGLSASMSFESFNGSFYTNIDRLESLPVQVEKKDMKEGVKYKINGNRYKVGAGGANLDFETFNGNVYLKEKLN